MKHIMALFITQLWCLAPEKRLHGANRMKYVYFLLTILILCSCSTPKKDTQHPADRTRDALLILPETTPANAANASSNSNPYTFRFSNGTYHDMNDLTYFLADTSIKSLRLFGGRFHDLSPLAELSELEELEITSNSYITDISPIGSLVNLKKLTLHNGAYEGSIEALSSLVNLEELSLDYSSRYYRELVPLRKLEKLMLSNAPLVVFDATYIAQLSSLKKLGFTGGGDPEGIINIEQLKNLVNLEELIISSNNNLDLSWITSLQRLKKFATSRCTIDDVSPLLKLPNLVVVDFTQTRVKDITPLLESRSIKSMLIAYPPNEDEINHNDLYRLFEERGIEYTHYYHDR
jgi:Leucine-rich repeat (LRR) protein